MSIRRSAGIKSQRYMRPGESTGTAATMIEFVLGDFAAEGVAMDAQDFRGARLITVGALEDTFDEAFFEFADGLIEKDAALDHQRYQAF
jgi:hypothetical protein